jgi:hypothetical protein
MVVEVPVWLNRAKEPDFTTVYFASLTGKSVIACKRIKGFFRDARLSYYAFVSREWN